MGRKMQSLKIRILVIPEERKGRKIWKNTEGFQLLVVVFHLGKKNQGKIRFDKVMW
jgi:hypothetical protein